MIFVLFLVICLVFFSYNYADRLSRNISLQEHSAIVEDIENKIWRKGQSAKIFSRNFLRRWDPLSAILAVKAWDRYCKSLGTNMLCIQGNELYSTSDTISLIVRFAAFEALGGISPLSTLNIYLPAIKNIYILQVK